MDSRGAAIGIVIHLTARSQFVLLGGGETLSGFFEVWTFSFLLHDGCHSVTTHHPATGKRSLHMTL